MGILSGEASFLNCFCLPSERGLVLLGAKFPFRVEPFSEGIWCKGKQTALYRKYGLASVAHLDVPSDWRPGGREFNPR